MSNNLKLVDIAVIDFDKNPIDLHTEFRFVTDEKEYWMQKFILEFVKIYKNSAKGNNEDKIIQSISKQLFSKMNEVYNVYFDNSKTKSIRFPLKSIRSDLVEEGISCLFEFDDNSQKLVVIPNKFLE